MSHALPNSSALSVGLAGTASDTQVDANSSARAEERTLRITSIVAEHYAFLWRSLRRLGVPAANAEDAAQKCLWVIAQRIDRVARGKEKTFLFGVALRVAKAMRRECRTRPLADDESLAQLPATDPDPGEQLDERRARILLDALLESLLLDLRAVFVLYEIEELTMAEIASALEIPSGTVASRLRRAREAFETMSLRIQRQRRTKEGAR